jgi:hypothetical protein
MGSPRVLEPPLLTAPFLRVNAKKTSTSGAAMSDPAILRHIGEFVEPARNTDG